MNTLTIPLTLVQIEENYGKKISINYSDSKLKGSSFFRYLSNLNMEYTIVGLEQCTLEEKKELLLFFVKSKEVLINFPEFASAYYEVIFAGLALPLLEVTSFLTPDESKELAATYAEEL